jgi:ankyrin repeat protein
LLVAARKSKIMKQLINIMKKRSALFLLTILIAGFSTGYSQNDVEIVKAIESGDLESFKQKVDLLEDINKILYNGYTALNYSIKNGRVDFAEYLLTKNVDIEKENGNQSPLMYSARYNTDILELLISKGADINREIDGRTALIAALEEERQDAINLLAANGATLAIPHGVDGPYIYYDTTLNITTIVTVNKQDELIKDTLKKIPEEIIVKTPFNESFLVSLKKPKIEIKSVFKKPEKIFVLSDFEGDYYDFVISLKNNGIIDNNLNWKFGKGHLVLIGDFVDRGMYVTQVLWLIYKLEQDAKEMGGKVHYILGNHELMILSGYFRYVNTRYKILAFKTGIDMYDFYGDQTELGAWIRTKNVIEKIGDMIFVHAGISDSLFRLKLSVPEMNRIARKYIYNPHTEIKMADEILFDDHSLLWYRGYIKENGKSGIISQNSVNKILNYYKADKFVIAHTIVDDISADYEDKVIRLDVDHYTNPSVGILIEGDKIYKADKAGGKELLY